MSEIKDKQLKIIKHYGEEKQLNQLIEECSELIQAICKYKRYKTNKKINELIAEMADVENLIEQFKLKNRFIFGGIEAQKVDREISRMARR